MKCSICQDKPATNKCTGCYHVFCDKCGGLHAKTFAGTLGQPIFTEIRIKNETPNKL